MYGKLPNLVIGFHGCSKKSFEKVMYHGESLKASLNSYDWLGNGIYFWEHNYQRASEWAKNRFKEDAAVIGAVIDLGYCLNLTDSAGADVLRMGYKLLEYRCRLNGEPIPENKKSLKTKDVLLRDLDCAVIQQIHDYNRKNYLQQFDSVRGIFTEGEEVYPGSEFKEKTHIQLCVCNPNCIKGYFVPRDKADGYSLP